MSDLLFDTPLEGVMRITFNRPDQLNAFTYRMYEELLEKLETIRYDAGVRAVILTGNGRAFCPGNDMKGGGGKPSWIPEGLAPAERSRALMTVVSRVPSALRSLPQPVIGAINGPAAGMGFAMALSCDICIATKAAKFVPAFHNAGTGSEAGMSWLLPRIVGVQRAMDILITGRAVLADEAAQIGLVAKVLDDTDAMNMHALDIARMIIGNVPRAVNQVKQSIWAGLGIGSYDSALELEMRAIIIGSGSEDAQEKRMAMAENRPPSYKHR